MGCGAGFILLLIALPDPPPEPSPTGMVAAPRATFTRTAPAATAGAWNRGGTLHRATVAEWLGLGGSSAWDNGPEQPCSCIAHGRNHTDTGLVVGAGDP